MKIITATLIYMGTFCYGVEASHGCDGKYGIVQELQSYLALDVIISQESTDKNPIVRRYFVKNVKVDKIGHRDFIFAEGALDGQKSICVPVDRIAFIGGIGNNQEFTKAIKDKVDLFNGK